MNSELQPLWLYFLLVAGIVALPGMDMAYVLASSLGGGRRAGLAATAGITCAGFVHVAAGVLGLGLLLQASPLAFNLLLAAGAAYLGWMGISLWRAASLLGGGEGLAVSGGVRSSFARGALTALLNPKAYVFGIAVFPQFLGGGANWISRGLSLAAITATTQIAIYGAVALAAAASRRWLQGSPVFTRAVAALLVATAVWTLAQGWRSFS